MMAVVLVIELSMIRRFPSQAPSFRAFFLTHSSHGTGAIVESDRYRKRSTDTRTDRLTHSLETHR